MSVHLQKMVSGNRKCVKPKVMAGINLSCNFTKDSIEVKFVYAYNEKEER